MAHINPNGLYCAYLRKSRRDMELEALGQGETLARHQKQLEDLAARLGIRITQTYREIVSGDTIAERPEVQRLLADVNAGAWDGVLAVDVDRFGRGDSIDQGIIMQSFLYSNTLILTPGKIYDPSDDSDAEFFEIKLFFSRREYSMIKKRMQRGRLASVTDGCYMGTRPVYGYNRVKLKGRKGWSLEVVPEKAQIVRSVFSWYADGLDGRDVGAAVIANHLNDMGLKTDLGNPFEASYIRHMLQNPAYIGKVQWNQRTTQYQIRDGRRVKSRPKCDAALLIDGLHEPIVDRALFDRVQRMFATHVKRPKNAMARITNPLAGLVVCGVCGRHLQYKDDKNRRCGILHCVTAQCATCGTSLDVVESVTLDVLQEWYATFNARMNAPQSVRDEADAAARAAAIAQATEQLETLQGQSDRLYDLLEQGVYSIAVYRQRRDDLDGRMDKLRADIAALEAGPRLDPIIELLPRIKTVLEAYNLSADPAERNALLRSVIDHITYTKTQRCYRNNNPADYLTLDVFPRLPSETSF